MILSPVIAIDGPSGSGKSTLSQALSKYLKWFHLESGLIYRILACLFLKKKNSVSEKLFLSILHDLDNYFVYKNGAICSLKNKFSNKYIMSYKVTKMASKLAIIPFIRKNLLLKQRLFRQYPGLVANGRDIGTEVFPDATIKFFLQADLKVRAKRRILDLQKQGLNINYEDLIKQMQERDDRDKNRICSPLKPSNNAIILDSTSISFSKVFEIAIKYIKKTIFV